MKDLTVIIVSFNTKKLTLAAVDSVKRGAGKSSFEIIVIDNDSKDGSLEALQKLKKAKQVRLIANSSNTGFAFANNQGIKIAKGKHVLLLNSDTVCKDGSLDKLVKFANKTKDAGVVASRLLNADGSIQDSVVRFPSVKNAILQYWFGKKGLFDKYAPKGSKPVVVESAVGASFLMTQRALNKLGGLDEKYFFYFEDIAYCREIKRAGMKVYYLPSSEVVHYHGASGKKIAPDKDQWRRLIPSSKIYHGLLKHYLLTTILWIGQKWESLTKKN